MDRIHHPERFGSFIGRQTRRKSDVSSSRSASDLSTTHDRFDDDDIAWIENVEEVGDENIDEIFREIDPFIADNCSSTLEIPDAVDTLSKIVDYRIAKYCSESSEARFGMSPEEDSCFLEAVSRISKLANAFGNLPAGHATALVLNRTTMTLHHAMVFLEEELRDILEDSNCNPDHNLNPNVLDTNQRDGEDSHRSASVSQEDESISDLKDQEHFPEFLPEVVTKMAGIATVMISAGYENECCQVYSIVRRNAFDEALKSMEFEAKSIEDVQRMYRDGFEAAAETWIQAVKHCAAVLFPRERKLCDSIFTVDPSISQRLFHSLAQSVLRKFINFADAIALTKRSAEKLFKYLDMYEVLRDVAPAVVESCSVVDNSAGELSLEISDAVNRIAETAVYIFCDLENSIKCDAAKIPVPGGAIHPLTRYVMNYLKYACEFKDTLEQIFHENQILLRSVSLAKSDRPNQVESPEHKLSAFAFQLTTVMELLDSNLVAKSKLYKDPSLRYIFLMNNGRYILQKIKGSGGEILQLVGHTWYRIRSTVVRHYHKNYQRETWGRVLGCLSHEGLQVNGKVNKPALKERFKNFGALIDEIHKTQRTWVVGDEQLRSELRASIAAVVIPAYRSFLGRFRQYLDGGRAGADKYIKYQPEDVETLIEELFDGNTASMSRKRT
ncbi:exocyst complex component EXO70B1-like [Diospyros lotus]|uniref:exocyst complex component EXO70B1-like n=1 Tax=Diospyros lotus TaxID=55363 RepID=UPI002250EA61|nr:exocyst complex component EXO70B1-like [Diospyros lotus]